MWQRFTERARRVVFYAQEEAGRLGENYVSTEHLLLGLVRKNDSIAAEVLERMGISLQHIRSEIERQVTRGDGHLGQDMQLTPRAKRVIDLAYDEARQLSNNYIGSEHLLLGLIREGEGPLGRVELAQIALGLVREEERLAGRVLAKLGVQLERTRDVVREVQRQRPPSLTRSPNGVPRPETGTFGSTVFEREFRKLTSEQQQQMQSHGLPLRDLSPMMQGMLHVLVGNPDDNKDKMALLDPDTLVRVNVVKSDTQTHYTVTAGISLLVNMLVKDA